MPESTAGQPRKTRPHEQLTAWQKAISLVSAVYRKTDHFPSAEQFGLVSQMRRAAVSVPANLAEGAGRGSEREFVRFLSVARGSLCELETHLLIAHNLGFINKTDLDALLSACGDVDRLINGLKAKHAAKPMLAAPSS